MGMVFETKTGKVVSFPARQNGPTSSTDYSGATFQTLFKEQYGYRSGPLSKEETNALFEYQKTSTWGQTATSIAHLERIMRANNTGSGGKPNVFGVNPREYVQSDFTPGSVLMSGLWSSNGLNKRLWSWIGSLGLTELSATRLEDRPSEVDIRAMAAKALRNVRPTQPSFDLTRFVGELKDANKLFQLPASAGSQAIGGAYLGVQFGWKPTASDIQRGAESILAADQKYVKFLEESNRERAVRSRIDIGHENWTGARNPPSTNITGPRTVDIPGLGRVQFQCPMSASSMRPFGIEWYIGSYSYVDAFAHYLWFSYDPDEFSARRQSYVDQARKILGGGLTVSTAYELVPFSWMVDWFYDIGGLLAYQQDVADYNLVAKRMGASYRRKFSVELKASPPANTANQIDSAVKGTSVAIVQQHYRYPGNPYDMSTSSWTSILSDPFRASILAALGLTRAKNIPFIR